VGSISNPLAGQPRTAAADDETNMMHPRQQHRIKHMCFACTTILNMKLVGWSTRQHVSLLQQLPHMLDLTASPAKK